MLIGEFMTISDDCLSKLLFESNNDNAPFQQEFFFANIEALAVYIRLSNVRICIFIDKRNSHKSHYHKASKTTYKRVKIYLKLLKLANSAKSDLTGDKCNKVFIDNALK